MKRDYSRYSRNHAPLPPPLLRDYPSTPANSPTMPITDHVGSEVGDILFYPTQRLYRHGELTAAVGLAQRIISEDGMSGAADANKTLDMVIWDLRGVESWVQTAVLPDERNPDSLINRAQIAMIDGLRRSSDPTAEPTTITNDVFSSERIMAGIAANLLKYNTWKPQR